MTCPHRPPSVTPGHGGALLLEGQPPPSEPAEEAPPVALELDAPASDAELPDDDVVSDEDVLPDDVLSVNEEAVTAELPSDEALVADEVDPASDEALAAELLTCAVEVAVLVAESLDDDATCDVALAAPDDEEPSPEELRAAEEEPRELDVVDTPPVEEEPLPGGKPVHPATRPAPRTPATTDDALMADPLDPRVPATAPP